MNITLGWFVDFCIFLIAASLTMGFFSLVRGILRFIQRRLG
ncbi:hypothetical protein [Thermosediminibacter oceani]|nr:hypothetical protein [Thermosediminibacter oceani]